MACHILGAPNMALQLTAPTSVECLKKEGTSPFMFPKKSVTRFEFPARGAMPAVKVFWYDAQTGAAYKPEGVPEGEPLIGGAGALGARGQAFNGGGAVDDAPPAAPPLPDAGRSRRTRRRAARPAAARRITAQYSSAIKGSSPPTPTARTSACCRLRA